MNTTDLQFSVIHGNHKDQKYAHINVIIKRNHVQHCLLQYFCNIKLISESSPILASSMIKGRKTPSFRYTDIIWTFSMEKYVATHIHKNEFSNNIKL